MNILLNDVLTLSADPQGGHFIITGVTGLGMADIRTSSFLFSGRSGGLVTDQLLGFRTIAITGIIGNPSSTRAQHRLDRVAMLAALPIGTIIPVYITVFDGETYRIDCSVTDLKMEYKTKGYRSDFLLQLTAGDPLFYSTDGGDSQTAHILRVAQGGYVTPYILPVVWDSGSSPTIVTNTGDAPSFPVITINDEALNPSITNQTTGETFELEMSTVPGDVIVIDMAKRTVTLNGSSILGNKTTASIWWALQPGDNGIVLDSDSSGDTVTADIVWRNGIMGI